MKETQNDGQQDQIVQLFDEVVESVLEEVRLYTNYDALDDGEREAVDQYIIDSVLKVFRIRPSLDVVFNVVANHIFGALTCNSDLGIPFNKNNPKMLS